MQINSFRHSANPAFGDGVLVNLGERSGGSEESKVERIFGKNATCRTVQSESDPNQNELQVLIFSHCPKPLIARYKQDLNETHPNTHRYAEGNFDIGNSYHSPPSEFRALFPPEQPHPEYDELPQVNWG